MGLWWLILGYIRVNIRFRSKSWSNSLDYEIGGPVVFDLIIMISILVERLL